MNASFIPSETVVEHGFAAVDLVDGTVADGMPLRRLRGSFQIELDELPRGLRVLHRDGRLVFSDGTPSTRRLPFLTDDRRDGRALLDLRGPVGELRIVNRAAGARADCGDGLAVIAVADEGLLTPPDRPALQLSGTITDPAGRWLPRRFALSLPRGALATLPLWPAPAAMRASASGCVIARLWFGSEQGQPQRPAAFALATLAIAIAPTVTVTVRAQADAAGDLILAPSRIPPVPSGLPGHPATLIVHAVRPPANRQADLLDPAELETPARRCRVGDPVSRLAGGAVRWLDPLQPTWIPGRRQRLSTFASTALLIQPPP